jgi:hypothetical protein
VGDSLCRVELGGPGMGRVGLGGLGWAEWNSVAPGGSSGARRPGMGRVELGGPGGGRVELGGAGLRRPPEPLSQRGAAFDPRTAGVAQHGVGGVHGDVAAGAGDAGVDELAARERVRLGGQDEQDPVELGAWGKIGTDHVLMLRHMHGIAGGDNAGASGHPGRGEQALRWREA